MSLFFDTSALAKLYHQEVGSEIVDVLLSPPQTAFVSRLGITEMHSVLAAKVRTRVLTSPDHDLVCRQTSLTRCTSRRDDLATVLHPLQDGKQSFGQIASMMYRVSIVWIVAAGNLRLAHQTENLPMAFCRTPRLLTWIHYSLVPCRSTSQSVMPTIPC